MYKERVEDYNMATLLRVDATMDYSEENTTLGKHLWLALISGTARWNARSCVLVPRIQFYAIEIARNKEGHNTIVREKFRTASKNIDQNWFPLARTLELPFLSK